MNDKVCRYGAMALAQISGIGVVTVMIGVFMALIGGLAVGMIFAMRWLRAWGITLPTDMPWWFVNGGWVIFSGLFVFVIAAGLYQMGRDWAKQCRYEERFYIHCRDFWKGKPDGSAEG